MVEGEFDHFVPYRRQALSHYSKERMPLIPIQPMRVLRFDEAGIINEGFELQALVSREVRRGARKHSCLFLREDGLMSLDLRDSFLDFSSHLTPHIRLLDQ